MCAVRLRKSDHGRARGLCRDAQILQHFLRKIANGDDALYPKRRYVSKLFIAFPKLSFIVTYVVLTKCCKTVMTPNFPLACLKVVNAYAGKY
jgi:hypothetical protein